MLCKSFYPKASIITRVLRNYVTNPGQNFYHMINIFFFDDQWRQKSQDIPTGREYDQPCLQCLCHNRTNRDTRIDHNALHESHATSACHKVIFCDQTIQCLFKIWRQFFDRSVIWRFSIISSVLSTAAHTSVGLRKLYHGRPVPKSALPRGR